MSQQRDTLEDYTQGTLDAARAEIVFAFERQPLWRTKVEEAGLTANGIASAEDVRQLPKTHKADYRRHFPHGVLARGRRLTDRFVHRSQSSGTAGDRCVTVTDKYVLAARMHRTLSVHPAISSALEELRTPRSVRYAAPNCSDVECATPFSTLRDRLLPDGMLVLPVAHDLLSTSVEMIHSAIDELIEWRPDWIYADPTHLAFLARQCIARAVPPPPCACVTLTFTQATRVARRQLATFFPDEVPCAEVVSMSEFGWLAMECPLGTMHLNVDSFYPELLVDDRPARVGETGELVITSIGDRLCPHVRYRTGDCFRLLERCACGHRFPSVRSEGRLRDMLILEGVGTMTPKEVDRRFNRPWLDLYKVEQTTERHVDVRLVANSDYTPGAELALRTEFEQHLGPGVTLTMERVSSIPCERSGKFISCISRVAARLAS